MSEIFSQESEAGFRAKEVEAVADAAATPGAVIATGGGVVLDPRNVEALRESSGKVVYLRASAAVAAARLGTGGGPPASGGHAAG